jgi:hypothetical protein
MIKLKEILLENTFREPNDEYVLKTIDNPNKKKKAKQDFKAVASHIMLLNVLFIKNKLIKQLDETDIKTILSNSPNLTNWNKNSKILYVWKEEGKTSFVGKQLFTIYMFEITDKDSYWEGEKVNKATLIRSDKISDIHSRFKDKADEKIKQEMEKLKVQIAYNKVAAEERAKDDAQRDVAIKLYNDLKDSKGWLYKIEWNYKDGGNWVTKSEKKTSGELESYNNDPQSTGTIGSYFVLDSSNRLTPDTIKFYLGEHPKNNSAPYKHLNRKKKKWMKRDKPLAKSIKKLN